MIFKEIANEMGLTLQTVKNQKMRGIKIKGLSIGDLVPDIEFRMLNYPKLNIKLSDFKGKLVLLDFWAIWCSNCIPNFPKLKPLQASFKGKAQVILVSSITSLCVDFSRKKSRSNYYI
jgi:thiol-disulfide isomerase/thioredoxin